MIRKFTPTLVIVFLILVLFNSQTAFGGSCGADIIIEDASCNGENDGFIAVKVSQLTQPYTIIWDPTILVTVDSAAYNLGAGSYMVTITDGSGCTSDTTIIIEEPDPIVITPTTVRPIGGQANGQVSLSVVGGSGGYSYQWTNAVSNTDSASNLQAGIYGVVVTDANGCTAQSFIALGNVSPIQSNISKKDVHCFNQQNGKAWIIPTGGNPPLTYQWSTGSTNDSIFNLVPGWYKVSITDLYGFSLVDSIFVDQPDAITFNSVQNNVSCFGGRDGGVVFVPSGGTQPYTSWTWNGPGGFFSNNNFGVNNLVAGEYFVTVFDSKGCLGKDSVNILGPTQIDLNLVITPESAPGASDGGAVATPSGGTPYYTYLWDIDGTIVVDSIVDNIPAGQYPLTITDANGCQKSTVINIPRSATNDSARCQFIYNAYPVNNPNFDVFIFDAAADTLIKTLDTTSYLDASPFYGMPANVPIAIKTSPANNPPNPNIANTVLTVKSFEANFNYIMILNSDDPLTSITADVYEAARTESSVQDGKSFQALVYHGSKDMGRANVKFQSISGNENIQNIVFRDFSNIGYVTLNALEDYTVIVEDFNGVQIGEVEFPTSTLNLVGDAIVVMLSGVVNGGYEEELGLAGFNPNDGSTFRFTADLNVSIEEFNNGESVIYPNPFGQQLFIKHSFNDGDIVRIADLSGRIIIDQQIKSFTEQITLDLQSLSKGTYLVEIKQPAGIYRSKVVKAW